jgi:hypothetical protein
MGSMIQPQHSLQLDSSLPIEESCSIYVWRQASTCFDLILNVITAVNCTYP